MPYHYEVTSDFEEGIREIDTLVVLARNDDEHRQLFLKLAIVSLVTKFQVFVERVLQEFRYELQQKPYDNLPVHLILNSLSLSILEDNPLVGLTKHKNYTEEKKTNVIRYLQSISYMLDGSQLVDENLRFKNKFPLGKSGKNELIDLLKQIDGDDNPFISFEDNTLSALDSILQTRHLIIHQDRFGGTETTVNESIVYLKKLAIFIDGYLEEKINRITQV